MSTRDCSSPRATRSARRLRRPRGRSRDESAALHQRSTALRAERDTLRLDERQKLARLDLLTFQRDEIARPAPRPGEDDALEAERAGAGQRREAAAVECRGLRAALRAGRRRAGRAHRVWKRVAELAALDPRAQPYLERAGRRRVATGGPGVLPARLCRAHRRLARAPAGGRGPPGAARSSEAEVRPGARRRRSPTPRRCRRELAALQSSDERAAEVEALLRRPRREYRTRAEASLARRRQTAATRSRASWSRRWASWRWGERASTCGSSRSPAEQWGPART